MDEKQCLKTSFVVILQDQIKRRYSTDCLKLNHKKKGMNLKDMQLCSHKDVESGTIHKDRCKFKVASNSDKIPNLQHSSCTMSNFLEKSINHLSTRTNLPVHNRNPKNY